jgi:hypothetical protein
MRRRLTRGTIVAVVAVGAAAVGGAALAGGVFDRKADRTAFLNDAAQQLNVSPEKLQDALLQAYDNRVDAWVAAGQITKEQGQALKDRAAKGGVPLNVSPRGGGRFGGPGFGGGLPGLGPWVGGAIGDVAKSVADYLGISQDTLMSELQSGKTLADIATAHGKTKDGLKQAIKDAAKTELDQAVKDGKLTQTVEDDLLSKLDDQLETVVTTKGGLRFELHGRGDGFGFGFGIHPGGVDVLDAASKYIGISEDELRTELQSGKTLAQAATDHGKTKDGLKQALHDATKTSLDQAVKDGKITQSVADQILSKLDSNLEQVVTNTGPKFRPHFRGGGFGGLPPDDPSDPGSSTPTAALPVA